MQLPRIQKRIFLESFIYLCYSSWLLKSISFKKVAAKLGEAMTETDTNCSEEEKRTALEIGKKLKKLSLYTPFRSKCFEQAIALKFLLNKRGIEATIYLGVLKAEEEEEMQMKAHAWTRVGSVYPTGFKGKDKYSIISTFGVNKK